MPDINSMPDPQFPYSPEQLEALVASVDAGFAALLAGLTQNTTAIEALTVRIADLESGEGPVTPGEGGVRLSWAKLTFSVPDDEEPGDYADIPGYPGAGKAYIGSCPTAESNEGYPAEWFDQRMFASNGVSGATKKAKLIRRYIDGPKISTEERANAQAFMSEGRLLVASFKLSTYAGGNWSLAQVVAGAADDDIKAGLNFWKNAKGPGNSANPPVWLSFWHEPEDNFENAAEQKLYRQAYRRIVNLSRELGLTNVAWVAPFFITINDFKNLDFKAWHPEWNDAGTGWVKDSAGNRAKFVDILGLDYYTPRVFGVKNPQTASSRNSTWAAQITGVTLGRYAKDGGRPMPIVLGEFGQYTTAEAKGVLDADGDTASQMLNALVETGIATQDVIGICCWNHSNNRFDAERDLPNLTGESFGERTKALRNLLAGNVLRTPAGALTTAATPRADYRWVAAAGGSRFVNIGD